MHEPLPFPGLPPSPAFENQTVQMVVRPTLGGERVRIRISNAFGTTALVIGAARENRPRIRSCSHVRGKSIGQHPAGISHAQ